MFTDVQAGLRLRCLQTPKTGFLALRPIFSIGLVYMAKDAIVQDTSSNFDLNKTLNVVFCVIKFKNLTKILYFMERL